MHTQPRRLCISEARWQTHRQPAWMKRHSNGPGISGLLCLDYLVEGDDQTQPGTNHNNPAKGKGGKEKFGKGLMNGQLLQIVLKKHNLKT